MKFLKCLILNLACVGATSSFAASKPAPKASVKVTAEKNAQGVKLVFTTIPADGLAINADGPWKLEIKSAKGVTPTKMELKSDAWQADINGFATTASVDKGAKTADVQFKMTTFVCTKEKSMCYREVVEDSAKVTF